MPFPSVNLTYTHRGSSVVAVQGSQQDAVVPIPWTSADAALAERDAELQQKDATLLALQQRIPGLEGGVWHPTDNFWDLLDTTTIDTQACVNHA